MATRRMCPVHPRSRPSVDARILAVSPRNLWLQSACCVSSLFFQHRESRAVKCPECYASTPAENKEQYLGVLRHYIHLGFPERFETCSVCSVQTTTLRGLATCPECLAVLEKFIVYLDTTGEQPWSESESTIIGISSARL